MKELLIFAGTTEGRKLSEYLAEHRIKHTICVATEYGELVLQHSEWATIQKGRLDQEQMQELIQQGDFAAVIDATHPYADAVTQNIKAVMQHMPIPYMRLVRETTAVREAGVTYFENTTDCAQALEATEGNILLTTGSKELAVFCANPKLRERLYVRVLPSLESIQLCMEQGIYGKQILAMQGPFSVEMNEACLHQYDISILVTKKSGRAGGFEEKLEAAQTVNASVFVIGHEQETQGYSFAEICEEIQKIYRHEEVSFHEQDKRAFDIVLAGIGMGNHNLMTAEVKQAIKQADILLGAPRMIEQFTPKIEKKPFYQAKQIVVYLQELEQSACFRNGLQVVVLFSGDSGFYSGCQVLHQAIKETFENASLRILPGISSVSYLASCIGESYHDAAIYSMHGKRLYNLAKKISRQEKTFLLLSGVEDMHRLGNCLIEARMEHCKVTAGYQLSYPNQEVLQLTAEECCKRKQEGLYICFIRNEQAVPRKLTMGKKDADFLRAKVSRTKVPMTKEEVREISLCKLGLQAGAVVYDIGSGTGSIAMEIAALSDDVFVYAIEQKKEAVALIEENKKQFHLENISVVEGQAPESFVDLPVPGYAFIGGSSGRLKEILTALYERNPFMHVVINAISMETICEMKEVLRLYPMQEQEIVQVQVSRVKELGQYHLMQAENPVWICSFQFRPV